MSLVSDRDYLIHSIRLSYLRDVEDPYGPRIISLDPSYNSNPFILASSLADVERWPELSMSISPEVSEDESERPSGFPGARLGYTQTITGGKRGGAGMRVEGKRASSSRRFSSTSTTSPRTAVQKFVSGATFGQESTSAPAVSSLSVKSPPIQTIVKSPSGTETVDVIQASDEAPVQRAVQFVPKFKHTAEMERRRRARIAARRPPGAGANPPRILQRIDFSSDEEGPIADDSTSDDSDFGDDTHEVDSLDEGDPFDLEFPTVPTGGNSDSDALSVSADTNSISASSGPLSAHNPAGKPQSPPLSPVSESGISSDDQPSQIPDSLVEMSFEMVTPIPSSRKVTKQHVPPLTQPGLTAKPSVFSPVSPTASDNYFTKKQVLPIQSRKSALSAMLASSDASSNPFSELYAAISGRGESASEDILLYFSHAKEPRGRPMELSVRKDAIVEEVIGFALWTYWKEGWLPKIDEGLSGESDPKWETKVSAVGWILRIAEEDGEVDDDFPPPDRLVRISKFNADAYAVMEASTVQIQQNQVIAAKIQRHPSRMTKKGEKLSSQTSSTPGSSTLLASTVGSVPLATSLGSSSNQGPPIFLRVRVADMADMADTVLISTTIPVTAGMYMQEALELVCRKRKLANPNDYALLLGDQSILIPLDRTVASLQGKRELLLIKRSLLPQIGDILKVTGKTTDPNASIFSKHMSDTPEIQYASIGDYTAGYKKYTIFRKAPMLLARQERTLAIDGLYVHIMPSQSNKARAAVFDSGKTSSYHIRSIADVHNSTNSSVFKLVLNRGGTNKRYDFEADNPRLAAEIVYTIKTLKATLDRSATVSKSRRSRHVG